MNRLRLLLLASSFALACSQPDTTVGTITGTPAPVAAAPTTTPRPPLTAVPIDGLPTFGDSSALVTIVEFTDYDCAYCARAEPTIHALRARYGADLRVAIAENPLPMHPNARGAALLALAAADEGRFESAHDALFAHQDQHSSEELGALATDLGMRTSFARSTTSNTANEGLTRSLALAKTAGVTGTPTFFINGRRLVGAQPYATFDDMISEELEHARALVQGGVARARVYDQILAEAAAHPAPLEEPTEPDVVVDEARNAPGALLFGAANARHTILLFTDFACPYCAKLDARLRRFVETHHDVRVLLRHDPLPMHASARLAAKAAMAAEAQGALTRYSALLFANQNALGRDELVAYADRLGLDGARFVRDLDAAETERRVSDDVALAKKLGATGTPTSFVDGRRVVGAQDEATFERALR